MDVAGDECSNGAIRVAECNVFDIGILATLALSLHFKSLVPNRVTVLQLFLY